MNKILAGWIIWQLLILGAIMGYEMTQYENGFCNAPNEPNGLGNYVLIATPLLLFMPTDIIEAKKARYCEL